MFAYLITKEYNIYNTTYMHILIKVLITNTPALEPTTYPLIYLNYISIYRSIHISIDKSININGYNRQERKNR